MFESGVPRSPGRTKAGFRGIRKLLSAGIGLEAYTITSARLVQLDLHLRRRRCFSFGMDDDDDGSPPPNRVGHAQQHLDRNVAGMASHNRRLAEQWMVVGASLLSPALPVQRTAFDSAVARCLGTFVKNFLEADAIPLRDAAGRMRCELPWNVHFHVLPSALLASLLSAVVVETDHMHTAELVLPGFSFLKQQALQFAKQWYVAPVKLSLMEH